MTTAGDEEILSLLDDESARTILIETREEAHSVQTLSELCEADDSTVYRLVDRMQERDLLVDHQELDPSGHHYKTYSARLERVEIRFTDEGVRVELDQRKPPADQFTQLYNEFTG